MRRSAGFLLLLAAAAAAAAPTAALPAADRVPAPCIDRARAAGHRTLSDPVPFSAWRIDPRRPSSPTAYV